MRWLFVLAVAAGCDGASMVDAGGGDAGMDAGEAFDCTGASDGTACGDALICLDETCIATACGDGYVDEEAGEQCEDGNTTAFDGCDPGCTFTCDDDAVCADADPCNGTELCGDDHVCANGVPLEDGVACATAAITGMCREGSCVAPGCPNGFADEGEECDDGNEVDGDGCDRDCTFSCDETTPCEDNDVCNGVAICLLGSHTCMPGTPLDCNDADACTNDTCDPVAGCAHALMADADMDGFAPPSVGACGTDCDDNDDTRYPGATELCDAIDQDCDGNPVAVTPPTWYVDCDGDGYAAAGAASMTGCIAPAPTGCGGGWTAREPTAGETDCNDADMNVRPRAAEVPGDPSDLDEDCDGAVACFGNADGDAYRTTAPIASTDADCSDPGETRASAAPGDCNDMAASAYPGAPEIASDTQDVDENCDGVVTCLADSDGDGYGVGSPMSSADADCADVGEARNPSTDNCPAVANDDQANADMDAEGDACDLCPDTRNDATVLCPTVYDVKRGTVVPMNQRLTFDGLVVTAVAPTFFIAQVPIDHPTYAGAEYSGIFVFVGPTGARYTDGTLVSVGDVADVSGRLSTYMGQVQLSPATAVRDATSTSRIPDPTVARPTEIVTGGSRAAALESVLTRVEAVRVTSVMAPRFVVDSVLTIDNLIYSHPPPPVKALRDITGILIFRFSQHRLNPRSAADVTLP